jgi:hypothetical protein
LSCLPHQQQLAPDMLLRSLRCFLLNLYDSLLSDGVAAPQDQALLDRFMTAYWVSQATLQPYALGISVKNNRKLLG